MQYSKGKILSSGREFREGEKIERRPFKALKEKRLKKPRLINRQDLSIWIQ